MVHISISLQTHMYHTTLELKIKLNFKSFKLRKQKTSEDFIELLIINLLTIPV